MITIIKTFLLNHLQSFPALEIVTFVTSARGGTEQLKEEVMKFKCHGIDVEIIDE